jgi:hypothetical protein
MYHAACTTGWLLLILHVTKFFVFLLWRGFIYSKGARGPQSTTPEGRVAAGGSPPRLIAIEATGIAFVVHAVEAVGATHGISAIQVVEGVARRRTRCGRCCRAACN